MSIGVFLEKDVEPTRTRLFAVLGIRQPLWEELTRHISVNYSIPGEWHFGGKNYGWEMWYRKSGKTLVTLYPQANGFVAQIVLGNAQVEQALKLKLGKNVGTLLRETPQLHDGRWLFIKVKTNKDVRDIQQLLALKRRPKPQQQA